MDRYYNANMINVPPGYMIEIFKTNLNVPINLEILENGDMYYGDAGIIDGNGKLVKITDTGYEVIADGFEAPLTGITYYKGNFYVSHRGSVTKVSMNGKKTDLLVGLPSYGDHHNNRVVFGPDGKMYFGQGSATNSGVVGLDNQWLKDHSYFHDYPAKPIKLTGKNFETMSLVEGKLEPSYTGAFVPFGTTTYENEKIKHILPGSGSILRADADGSNLELFAWGFRNPFRLKFDRYNQLWGTNHGMDVRGSRPIKNSPDEFSKINFGAWYGWPDYTGGYPVTNTFFKPDHGEVPQFLMKEHPTITFPFVNFIPHSAIMGFDFNYHPNFGFYNDVFIAEFGPQDPQTTGGEMLPLVGHRVSRIDMRTGTIHVFAENKYKIPTAEASGMGFERPIDVVFGPDKKMYIVDFGQFGETDRGHRVEANTGVIWRVSKIM